MSEGMSLLFIFSYIVEIFNAGVLVYAIAVSKAESKKVIKTTLIGTAVYIIVSIILFSTVAVVAIVMPFLVFTIIFAILGSHTEHKFNILGFISLIAYLVSVFLLPIVSNKNEDSLAYQVVAGLVDDLGGNLTPTQFEILESAANLSGYSDEIANYFQFMFILAGGAVLFAILFFDMALLRRNTAQTVMGSLLSVCAAGMLYLDYRIFHSDSLGGKLAGYALSKMGFSLSPLCILTMAFAILTVITAYRCNKKEKETT